MRSRVLFVLAILILMIPAGVMAAPVPQKITITIKEFSFTPNRVVLPADVPVQLTLVNSGKMKHEFWLYAAPTETGINMRQYAQENTYFRFRDIGETEVAIRGQGSTTGTGVFWVTVEPGKSVTISFTTKKKGTFEFACLLEGHYESGMKGTLVVK